MRLAEFTGARRIPLVGRQDLLNQAERSIGRGGVHITYLEGCGGIGKTALLEAILEQTQRGNRADALAGCCVAKEVIDLYHADVHTSEGLIRTSFTISNRVIFPVTAMLALSFIFFKVERVPYRFETSMTSPRNAFIRSAIMTVRPVSMSHAPR